MSNPRALLAEHLAGVEAWLVGGAVRDGLLGRPTADLDVVVAGDPEPVAQALRRATGAAAFSLSDAFGGWRTVHRRDGWTIDLLPLKDSDLHTDLSARDFTINAMAEPVAGGDLVDPFGGREDLAARRIRMVGPRALADDPLRTLRAVRLAAELDMAVEADTLEAARDNAPGLARVAAERIFAELRRIVGSHDPVAAVRGLEEAGVAAAVLPELLALRDVDQNVFHHRDVHDHTLEVLGAAVALERDPSPIGEKAARVLAQPLADDLTRWGGLRWAALLHDIAKPQTRGERPDGRVTFVGHDSEGAEVAAGILRRLRASERLALYVASLTRHHLRLGFLVHDRPLDPRVVHRYLKATAPWTVDVTVLTVVDRMATRGRNAGDAIALHVEVAREMLEAAEGGLPAPLVRGDVLARELGLKPGPRIGELLARLEEDQYAGELTSAEQALERARALLAGTLPGP